MPKSDPAIDDDKVYASIDDLLGKRPASIEHTILLPGGDGEEPKAVTLVLHAIPSSQYDTLVGEFPPNKEQKEKGQTTDWDRFAPALVAACLHKPAMSYEQAREMFTSAAWSAGELADLFGRAQALCLGGFDVPKSGNG
jgi:hypothetical protein